MPALDGLRGCAVLLILLGHFVGSSPLLDGPPGSRRSYVRFCFGLCGTGVDLFFVLSGFLIGGILLDHRESPRMLRAFYLRRFVRIVPVAWLCVGLSVVLFGFASGRAGVGIPWWCGLAFTTNLYLAAANRWILTPLTAQWSLGIEEQFYLVFPWIVRAWPRRGLGWLGPALVLGALGIRVVGYAVAPDRAFAFSMLTFCRFDSLGVGFAGAWLVRSGRAAAILGNRRLLWSLLAGLAIGLAVLLKCQYRSPGQMATWGYTAVALFYGVLLLIAYEPRERFVRVCFTAGWLRLYGRFSYFIYLFQVLLARPLVALAFHGRWRDVPPLTWPETAAELVILLPPAALSWYLIEAPLLRWGRRWTYG